MNIFKSFTLKWWQGSLLKIAMISLGIVIGATWPEIFVNWVTVLLIVSIVSASYITYIWWKQ